MHVLAVVPAVRDLLDCSLGCSSKILFVVFTDHMLSLGLVIFIDLLFGLIEGPAFQDIFCVVVVAALDRCMSSQVDSTPVDLYSFGRVWSVAFGAW